MNRISSRRFLEAQYDGPLPPELDQTITRDHALAFRVRRARAEVRHFSIHCYRLIRWLRRRSDTEIGGASMDLKQELVFLLKQRRRWKRHLQEQLALLQLQNSALA